MTIFRLECKNAWRLRYPFVVCFVIVLILYICNIPHFYIHSNPIPESIAYTLRFALIAFLGIAFISFEMFSDIGKKNWREQLQSSKAGIIHTILTRCCILMGMILFIFVNVLVIDLVLVFPANLMHEAFLKNTIEALFLNYILFPCVGMFVGMVLGALTKKIVGCFILAGYLILSIGVFHSVSSRIYLQYEGVINLEGLSRLFKLTQPNMLWIVDTVYLIPSEIYRYCVYFGWILLFLGILLFFLLGKRYRIIAVVSWLLCIVCFVNVWNPGSIMDYDSNTNNVSRDYDTFKNEMTEETGVKKAFDVFSYDMKLDFGKQLTASVWVDVEDDLPEYNFTLFRGYKIESICDSEGNSLEYTREADYITVYSEEKNIKELQFQYKGYSGTFYSNTSAAILPGFFAWYPQAGERPIFNCITEDSYYKYGYNKDISSFQEVEYKIVCSGYQNELVSNLDVEGNTLAGTSKAPTLLMGPFTQVEQNGIRIVYPSATDWPLDEQYIETYQNTLQEYESYLDMETTDEINTIFFLGGGFDMVDIDSTGFWLEDYLILSNMNFPEDTALKQMKHSITVYGVELELWTTMLDIMRGRDMGWTLLRQQYLAWEPEGEVPDWPTASMYKTLITQFDSKIVNERIIAFLQDQDNTMHCIDFLKELYLELEETADDNNS